MTMQNTLNTIALCCLLGWPLTPIAAEPDAAAPAEPAAPALPAAPADHEKLAMQKQAIDDAKRSLDEASQAVEDVRQAMAQGDVDQDEQVALAREELSRAHRELREASREVAMAHRALAGGNREINRLRMINLGDHPVIGVLLGEESVAGVELIGVSPDGPAEQAGLRQNDVLVSIGGVDLSGRSDGTARDALFSVMDQAKAGEELPLEVSREGEILAFTVIPQQREPHSWQSRVRLPGPPPGPPGTPGGDEWMEHFEALGLDEEELAMRLEEFTERAKEFEHMFMDEDGKTIKFSKHIEIDDEALSRAGEHALREANIWFGLPHTRGLELTSLNPELGKYFKTERGVLVIQAREDNAYGLESGDVIRAIGDTEVNSPGDLLRAMRDAEPGSEIELNIKRDRKDRTLKAKVPENHLGLMQRHHRPLLAAPPEPPIVR